MATAIRILAEQAAGGDESGVVVVGAVGDVSREVFGMVAAWHAMVVDRRDIARDGDGRVEAQPRVTLGEIGGDPGKPLALAKSRPAPGLLALLHRHAA
jgi:hypothetical protein